jgi:wobble nucleotide-excising tRNase
LIKKLTSIENIGILKSPSPTSDLRQFNKFNVVYGWNGSGKTTLGRLLRCLETKKVPENFPNAKFSVELDDSTKISSNSLEHSLLVRVFNNDFINDNLNLFDAQTKPIIFLSKEKIDEKRELDAKKAEYTEGLAEKKAALAKKEEATKSIDKIHQDIGRSIKNFLLGTIYADVTYNKATSTNAIWPLIKDLDLQNLILQEDV